MSEFVFARRHRLPFFVSLLALFLCVGCGGPYYTVEGSLTAKQLVIHDGEKEIQIDLGVAMGGALSGDAVAPDGSFDIEVDGVSVAGTVSPIGSVGVQTVIYKGKELGLGSMTDI